MPAQLLIGVGIVIGSLVACSDHSAAPDTMPSCPAQILAGDRCQQEGLDCPFPQARCESTRCRCRYVSGVLSWDCRATNCSCVCPCEKVVVASCEMLGCTSSPDPCPVEAADHCEMLCRGLDAGPQDGGADVGLDAAVDGAADAGMDTTTDGALDLLPDTPADQQSEGAVDAALDAADAAREQGLDRGYDIVHERGQDVGFDVTSSPNDHGSDRGRE